MMPVTELKLPFIERNPTRWGKMRYYFRHGGKRICRLPDDIESEEFAAEYWAARRKVSEAEIPPADNWTMSSPVRPRSFRWLCQRYMLSTAFTTLDKATQRNRRLIMESMWAEPLVVGSTKDRRVFADMPIGHLDVGNVEVLRDRKRATPFAANERVKILRQVFATKDDGKPVMKNVAKLVERIQVQTEGHHTITTEEIGQYIEHHGSRSKAVLALALMMYTGFRVSDLAQIGPQHRRGEEFRLRLFKNRNRAPIEVVLPIHPVLEEVLSWHPVRSLTYMVTEHGRSYSVKGLGNRVSDWFNQAGLVHCSAHSVRKGLAANQAENAATDKMLDAMFGWRDGRTSKIYTAKADRVKLAREAVGKISWAGVGERLLPAETTDETPAVASA